MTDYSSLIREIFSENGLDGLLNSSNVEKFNMLIDRMLTVNEKMNLTAITDGEDVILKHIADSATVVKYIPKNAKMLDVGTGGGFPSLPVAILRPDVSVYALDSTAKKLNYIEETAKILSLDNIKTVCGRAEVFGKSVNYRERFDIVTARAVASLNILTELCLPFVKLGGTFISMKGSSANEEITAARSGVIQLGGTKFEDIEFTLHYNDKVMQRHLVISKKAKNTPDSFPRIYSRIAKKPL
ncbi:MAG: 16S rRNA (guanine(527)-N(7))-methyltransferase RsmG [Ruminococcaceae bacterium]|nr:16S rRNA (guanine(527)-N(7))-methyltransferase RsmG [Oscillospiraceae bacterium]